MLTRPRILLHVEGAALLLAAVFLYWRTDGNWLTFLVLLLAPDIGMVGFLRDTRLGAAIYNLFHTETLPLGLAIAGVVLANTITLGLALIWLAHIGMDRALGYGLKYPTNFKDTHLGRL